MDLISLANRIYRAALYIDSGRKGFAKRGKEAEGCISYEDGITEAMTAFMEASNQGFAASANSQALILAEHAFLSQEFQLCDKSDKDTINSLTKAIQFFDDAFLALEAVKESGYKTLDKGFPHDKKYRVNGFPKDSFHIACSSHRTRLLNILRSPGIDPIEKDLLKQRLVNLSTAQSGYVELQKKAMGD